MKNREVTEFWTKSQKITQDMDWQKSDAGVGFDLERIATWAHWPNRYMLTEHADRETGLFKRNRVNTRIFELAILSAVRSDTGEREYSKYFIMPDETLIVSMQVSKDTGEETSNLVRSEYDFVIENSLMATNAEELLRLEYILNLAEQDGSEQYVSVLPN